METATRSVAVMHIDSVERKPLYHFRPGARVLTIAGPGCTFRCTYCVNHRLSQYGREPAIVWSGRAVDLRDIVDRAVAERAVLGMSYSEPGLAPELTLELARHARPHGVPIVWKTNGFLTAEAIDLVAPTLAAVNIDIKAADEADHRRLTGASLRPVLDAVEHFLRTGVWVEVSTPLIPGVAASAEQLARIAGRIAALSPDLPWHLLRFTPDFRMAGYSPTSPAVLAEAVTIGRSAGLRHVYVERALGPAGRATTCPRCAAGLVERDIWAVRENRIIGGMCPGCGLAVPGIWE